jgi:hypothetical protein
VAGVFGDRDDVALYALLDSPAFEPTRHAAVTFNAGEVPQDDALGALDAVVLVEGTTSVAPALRARLDTLAERGLPLARVGLPLDAAEREALARLAHTLDDTGRDAVAGTLSRESPQRTRVTLPGAGAAGARSAWLVVSEPWSLYAGWRLVTDADPPRTLAPARADGVVSALLLQPGERSVRARYAPSDARAGLLLGGIGLLGVLALLCWPERPRLPETRDTRVRPPAAEPR